MQVEKLVPKRTKIEQFYKPMPEWFGTKIVQAMRLKWIKEFTSGDNKLRKLKKL